MRKLLLTVLMLTGAAFAVEPKVSTAENLALIEAQKLALNSTQQAVELLKKNQNDKSSAAIDYAIAIYQVKRQKNAEALAELKKALKKEPNFHRAKLTLAKIHFDAGNWTEASAALTELIDSDYANKTVLWKLQAFSLYEQQRYNLAEVAFKNALLRKDDPELWRGLLSTLLDLGKHAEARPILKKMLNKNPKDKELWSLSAAIELAEDNDRAAMVKLATAHKLDACDNATKLTLASLYFNAELYELAAKIYLQVPTKELKNESKIVEAVRAFTSIDKKEIAQKLLSRCKKKTVNYYVAAIGLNEQTEKLLQEAMKKYPTAPEILILQADFLVTKKSFTEAELLLKRLTRVGNKALALEKLGHLKVSEEKYRTSIDYFAQSLQLKENKQLASYVTKLEEFINNNE